MPRFRKKPVKIEARRFETNNDDGSHLDGLVAWIIEHGGESRHDGTDLYIVTPEGEMRASCFDWIIKGVKGEFYPCKPDIFEETYDQVSAPLLDDYQQQPRHIISYDWLESTGFIKLERGERQPTDHCMRCIAGETIDEHWMIAREDLCIEVCPDRMPPDTNFWLCWVGKSHSQNRSMHTFTHVRHMKYVEELMLLYEGLTGRPFSIPCLPGDRPSPLFS